MKGLTIYQPWATLIAEGFKEYETRPWRTPYRGLLAIHAGKTGKYLDEARVLEEEVGVPEELRYPVGAILAIATLGTVVSTELHSPRREEIALGDWSRGRFAWRLDDVRKLKSPVPCRGYQNLWDVPPDALRLIQTVGLAD